MKDKNLPPDNKQKSLDDLTNEVNSIIESLEWSKDLKNSTDLYQELLRLNNIIEKKFKKNMKEINEETKKRINNIILKKNEQ